MIQTQFQVWFRDNGKPLEALDLSSIVQLLHCPIPALFIVGVIGRSDPSSLASDECHVIASPNSADFVQCLNLVARPMHCLRLFHPFRVYLLDNGGSCGKVVSDCESSADRFLLFNMMLGV